MICPFCMTCLTDGKKYCQCAGAQRWRDQQTAAVLVIARSGKKPSA